MSAEFNDWESKSIESELDKIRAKYLMSPSDFEKSSTFKHGLVRHTGTFRIDRDSVDTRNQSVDNYGNEVREFVIEHPSKNQISSQHSLKQTANYSERVGGIWGYDDKENFIDCEIIVEKDEFKNKRNCQIPKQNSKFANEISNLSNQNKIPVSEVISNRFGKITTSRTNLPEIPSTNDAKIDSKINIELNNKFFDQQKAPTSVK